MSRDFIERSCGVGRRNASLSAAAVHQRLHQPDDALAAHRFTLLDQVTVNPWPAEAGWQVRAMRLAPTSSRRLPAHSSMSRSAVLRRVGTGSLTLLASR